MKLIIPISSDPLNGFQRNVEMLDFDWKAESDNITLSLMVKYSFSQKGTKGSFRIRDYLVELICDNDSIVDPKTGEFVMVNADGIALSRDPITAVPLIGVGQYDFYIGMAQSGPVDIIGLITMLILRADTLKRFDI